MTHFLYSKPNRIRSLSRMSLNFTVQVQELVSEDNEKVGLLNDLFVNIGEKLARTLDKLEQPPREFIHRVTPTTG